MSIIYFEIVFVHKWHTLEQDEIRASEPDVVMVKDTLFGISGALNV